MELKIFTTSGVWGNTDLVIPGYSYGFPMPISHEFMKLCCKLVRKPGFAPGPSVSQTEMLLLHHNPDGTPDRTCTGEYEFTKLVL